MTLSVVIVTYNRPHEVVEALASLSVQTQLPTEIIIVDNCRTSPISESLNAAVQKLQQIGVPVHKYVSKQNSLPVARNYAIKRAVGDIVMFLDDDVVLEPEYLKAILDVYKNNPAAKGVQGFLVEDPDRGAAREFLHKLFFWYHIEEGRGRVLASASSTYPAPTSEIVQTEWMSGANHSYRREVFQSELYDEKLMKYADGEDLDMSYRVHLRFPGSLFLTPHARVVHKTSPSGRVIGKELVYMREVYGLYLFCKLFEPTLRNCVVYFWSRFGRIVFCALKLIRHLSVDEFYNIVNIFQAYHYCVKYSSAIRAGDLAFFNHTLTGVVHKNVNI